MKAKRIFIVLLLCSISSVGFSQQTTQIKSDFIQSFRQSKASYLNPYFKGYTSIQMPGHAGLFPAGKSKIYLNDFIKKHPAHSFQLMKSGYTGDNFYLIGNLKSDNHTWTIYLLFDIKDPQATIQQIEIEKTEK